MEHSQRRQLNRLRGAGFARGGQDPTGSTWSKGSNNPISFLLSLQLPDGSFEWQQGQGSNQVATQQAIVALLGRPFPLRVAPATWCPASYLPIVTR